MGKREIINLLFNTKEAWELSNKEKLYSVLCFKGWVSNTWPDDNGDTGDTTHTSRPQRLRQRCWPGRSPRVPSTDTYNNQPCVVYSAARCAAGRSLFFADYGAFATRSAVFPQFNKQRPEARMAYKRAQSSLGILPEKLNRAWGLTKSLWRQDCAQFFELAKQSSEDSELVPELRGTFCS